jgi:hypothetical protein
MRIILVIFGVLLLCSGLFFGIIALSGLNESPEEIQAKNKAIMVAGIQAVEKSDPNPAANMDPVSTSIIENYQKLKQSRVTGVGISVVICLISLVGGVVAIVKNGKSSVNPKAMPPPI